MTTFAAMQRAPFMARIWILILYKIITKNGIHTHTRSAPRHLITPKHLDLCAARRCGDTIIIRASAAKTICSFSVLMCASSRWRISSAATWLGPEERVELTQHPNGTSVERVATPCTLSTHAAYASALPRAPHDSWSGGLLFVGSAASHVPL